MKTIPVESNGDDAVRWLTFLSRCAFATVLFGIVGLGIYFMGVGFVPSDNALGIAYSDLMQAVRAPVMFRIFMTFDALGWLMIGVTLLTLAAILKSRAPLRP